MSIKGTGLSVNALLKKSNKEKDVRNMAPI